MIKILKTFLATISIFIAIIFITLMVYLIAKGVIWAVYVLVGFELFVAFVYIFGMCYSMFND